MHIPSQSNFFHFNAVVGKIWLNNRLVVASEISGSLWEILNPPLGAATFGGHLFITYFKVQGEGACP